MRAAPFALAVTLADLLLPPRRTPGIGYFPDVGVTRVLSRLDGAIGTYLGLTGDRITGEEAYLVGLATHYVPSSSLPGLTEALAALSPGATGRQVASTIDDFTVDPFENNAKPDLADKTAFLGQLRGVVDYVFGQARVEDIFASLEELSNPTSQASTELQEHYNIPHSPTITSWAQKTLTTLHSKSPRSLKVSYQAIRHEARNLSIDESFRFDMRLATAFCDLSLGRDFYDGVHHVLTKDPATKKRREGRAPWSPGSVGEVNDAELGEKFFGPLSKAELALSPPEMSAIPRAPADRKTQAAQAEMLRGIGPLGWEPAFNAFHPLPSEAELEALLHGSHPAAGSFQIDLGEKEEAVKEIVGTLQGWRSGRYGGGAGGGGGTGEAAWGMERKVRDWVERRGARK